MDSSRIGWLFCIALCIPFATWGAEPQNQKPAWHDKDPQRVGNLAVTLSEPVLVARSEGYVWFPTLHRLGNGELLAVMSNYHDDHVEKATSKLCWSGDGGLTWSAPLDGLYSNAAVRLSTGEQLLLPYYLKPQPGALMGAECQVVAKDKREAKVIESGVTVGGWPRPDLSFAPEFKKAGFVFNGNTVEIKGGHLATLYGYFQDTKRYSLVAAESEDGIAWRVRTTIADEKCELPGVEGPCEAATCRLKDGRLMCIFRLASNVPYGQTFSDDEGKTWSKPNNIAGPASVQPALTPLGNGTLVLTGGRPGLWAWFNAEGDGKAWESLDLMAHHNLCRPEDPISNPATGTSAYTEVVPLDDNSVLCIYDRLARGWNAIPKGADETNSVWVVRMTIRGR